MHFIVQYNVTIPMYVWFQAIFIYNLEISVQLPELWNKSYIQKKGNNRFPRPLSWHLTVLNLVLWLNVISEIVSAIFDAIVSHKCSSCEVNQQRSPKIKSQVKQRLRYPNSLNVMHLAKTFLSHQPAQQTGFRKHFFGREKNLLKDTHTKSYRGGTYILWKHAPTVPNQECLVSALENA